MAGFKTWFGCSSVLYAKTSHLNFVRFDLRILKKTFWKFQSTMQVKRLLLCSGNCSLHPFQSAFFFFFNLLFWANLGSQQNRTEVQRNPVHPGPQIHSLPHCDIPRQSGTFLTVSLFWHTSTSSPQWFLSLPSQQHTGDSTASDTQLTQSPIYHCFCVCFLTS